MEIHYRTRPAKAFPLGATWLGRSTQFSLYSEGATDVDLCLFDADGRETRVPIRQRTDHVWHVEVDGVGPGQLYAYRVHGPWDPARGLRYNPNNLLVDPYARALAGTEQWTLGGYAYDVRKPDKDLVRAEDDQRAAPASVVVDPAFDWGNDARPDVPMRKTVLYEAHVRSLTARHPAVPPELRGTYLGLAAEPVVTHLRELGVTAVVLLPVQAFVDGPRLVERGQHDHRGSGTLAYFAPDVRYRAGASIGNEVRQFKRMVQALHAAGIEIILDVAIGRTAEGGHLGPTLSFKGIDNAAYYRLRPGEPRYYAGGGTGDEDGADGEGSRNAFDLSRPPALRFVMDSLRYWAEEMHVDGFQLDRRGALGRSHEDDLARLSTVMQQDPILGRVKVIAEPLEGDEAADEAAVLPAGWAEENGRYAETMGAFWRGDGAPAREVGHRLTGSSDIHRPGGRPSSSVNGIGAHDAAARDPGRRARNLLATLLLSQGVPKLRAGEELGRAPDDDEPYATGDDVRGLDWDIDDGGRALLDFVRRVSRLRGEHPLIQRATFFRGDDVRGVGVRDVAWLRHDGTAMPDEDWDRASSSRIALFMAGSGLAPVDEDGRSQSDDDLLLVLNASETDLDFVLPALVDRGRAVGWELQIDTADDGAREHVDAGASTRLLARSLKLFSRRAVGTGGLQAASGVPVSTYRLQLRQGFGFRQATSVVDYLDDLGIGGVYTSPYFRATAGSTHGYDVVDPTALDPQLGSEAEYAGFTDAVRERRLQHVIDFVPNHVGIGSGENAWWMDTLENGPSGAYADWFDIEWNLRPSDRQDLRGKVLLPILGRQFGEEVDDGRIAVVRAGGAFFVEYGGKRLPASPRSYALVLERALEQLELPEDHPARQELASIASAIAHLPSVDTSDPAERVARVREKDVFKRRLLRLCETDRAAAAALDAAAAALSSRADRLERFLGEQNYRLSYWRVATEEINYRRFFDVNELAALRMEEPDVFAAAHARLFALIAEGRVTGVRLDHTDGLYDPSAYFDALQRGAREALRRAGSTGEQPIYAVAEKILEEGEELPRGWAISGSTGYDFLGVVGGLWIDRTAEMALTSLYVGLTGATADPRAVILQAKREVMTGSFASEIHVLSQGLKRIAERSRRGRDFTLAILMRAIVEVIAAFPVYRAYVRPDGSRSARDEAHVAEAVAEARRKNPFIEGSVFDFLEGILLLRDRGDDAVRFAMRFQQISGPIMAKGVEDTALFRYVRLICENDVGCDVGRFGTTVADFHAHNTAMVSQWPLGMTTTSTHDTKRSEDVRARIAVLSEIPEDWGAFVRDLRERTAPLVRRIDGAPAPSPGDVYFFFQTVVGAMPFDGLGDPASEGARAFGERLGKHMEKVTREAKVSTSWTTPNAAYDQAVQDFVRGVMGSPEAIARIEAMARRIASYGAANSLAQVALRLASPGVPDVYQGCELWDLSLTDPDNRRPVDFEQRRRALAQLRAQGGPSASVASDLVRTFTDGRIKLFVTHAGLRLRRELPALFLDGTYEPIEAPETSSEHVVAFQRTLQDKRLVCVVPRLSAKLTGGSKPWALGATWKDAVLKLPSGGRLQNVFTGETHEGPDLALAAVFETFPVAWLLGRPIGP